MKLNAGLNLDVAPSDQPDGSYRDAQNFLLTAVADTLASEEGFALRHQKEGYTLLAAKAVRDNGFVLFYRLDTGVHNGEIGYLAEDNTYRTVVNSPFLSFATTQKIQSAYYYNVADELIVVWTDGVNPPGIINITKPGLPASLTRTAMTRLQLFPPSLPPQVVISEGADPGAIAAGAYSFLLAYELADGSLTNYHGTYGSILVGDDASKQLSSVSVELRFYNLDEAYTHLRIYTVRDFNGTRTGQYIGRIPITTYGNPFLWSGAVLDELDAAELLLGNVSYAAAKTLTVANDRLLLGNLTLPELVDCQPYFNNVQVRWGTALNKTGGLAQNDSLWIQRSFMPSATYALYGAFILSDGSKTPYCHIPGRDYLDDSVFDPVRPGLRRADLADYATDEMLSIHRNEDERYSDEDRWIIRDAKGADIGSLKGKRVRHHRMPSAFRIKPSMESATELFGKVDIGISFHNIVVPPALVGIAKGVCFAYAVRDYANQDVITFMPVLSNDFALTPIDSPSNAIQPPTPRLIGKLRGYDFSLMVKKPALRNLFLVTEYHAGKHTVQDTAEFLGSAPGYSEVSKEGITYLTAGNVLQENDEREAAFTLNVSNVYAGINGGKLAPLVGETSQMGTLIPIASLRQATRNLYVGMDRQNLSAMSHVIPLLPTDTVVDSPLIFEGDVTRQDQTVRYMRSRTTPVSGKPDFSENSTVYKTISSFTYPLYSRLPVNKREEDPVLQPLLRPSLKKYTGEYLNQYLLNPSYELTNTFRGGSIAGSLLPLSRFPVRVAQSAVQGSESRTLNWRKFLPLDYYDHKPSAGELLNLESMGETLVLHHETGIYRTYPRQRLQTGESGVAVYLGTGSLFENEPQEIISSPGGYAGTRYSSGTLLSKFGYLFADAKAGKVFLLNQQLSEISSNGLRTWFADNLPVARDDQMLSMGYTPPVIDNPFQQTGIGYSTGYDERYSRLLLGKRDYELIDPALWGDPKDLEKRAPVAGKYYLLNGQLTLAVAPPPPVIPPVWSYDARLELVQVLWSYNSRIAISSIDWNYDNRVGLAALMWDYDGRVKLDQLLWAFDARYSLTSL